MRSSIPIMMSLAFLSACGGSDGPSVLLGPPGANTFDDLVVTLGDGKPEKYDYAWTIDGEPAEVSGNTVTADMTEKGQLWEVTVSRGGAEATASIVIGNARPSAQVSLLPTAPNAGEDVVATGSATDPDNDPTYVEYDWFRNGEQAGFTSRTLPAQATRRGDVWEVHVTPFDGDDAGEPAIVKFTIVNAVPEIEGVRLSRTELLTDDTVTVSGTPVDFDGDNVTMQYRWFVDGSLVGGATGNSLDGREHFDAGSAVWAEVRGADPSGAGPWARTSVAQVINARPSKPVVAVSPETPFEDENLTCSIVEAATDPDGDSITYVATWEVEGVPYTGNTTAGGLEGDTVPAADLLSDERWTCTVVASDGNGGINTGSDMVMTDARSGCVDGTTEVSWNPRVEACAAASQDTWTNLTADPTLICASGWSLADSSVVNSVLNGPGYSGPERYAFSGDGCNGTDSYASTEDARTNRNPTCVWRIAHYVQVSPDSDLLDGLMCVRDEE